MLRIFVLRRLKSFNIWIRILLRESKPVFTEKYLNIYGKRVKLLIKLTTSNYQKSEAKVEKNNYQNDRGCRTPLLPIEILLQKKDACSDGQIGT